MKLEKIEYYKDKYKAFLQSETPYYEDYKWENLKNFQDHWDIDAADFGAMYNQSLSSKYSARLWGGSKNSAKSVMLELIALNQEYMRSAFKDFFNDDKEVILRADRFSYHIDQLMVPLKKKKPKIIDSFHNNLKILSVYLAFRFPLKYCIYDYRAFRRMMVMLEAREVPEEFEISRFFKNMQNLHKHLIEDTELVELHKEKIIGEDFYQGDSLLLAHDFYWCCTRPEYKID